MRGLKTRVARRLPGSHSDTREASVPAVPPLSEFEEIRQQLKENGLFGDETLVLIAHDGVRVVFDSEGRLVRSELFDAIKAPLALFTPGTHTLTFATRGLPVYASNDDMAQMFGYATAIRSLTKGRASYSMEPDTFDLAPRAVREELLAR